MCGFIAFGTDNNFVFYNVAEHRYIKEKLKPFIQNEQQLIYLCHLFGPFMLRLDQERPRVGYEITTLLYELLEQVDKKQGSTPLQYMDPICDLL